jgi:hypothetical protein
MITYKEKQIKKNVVDDIICNICQKSTLRDLNHSYINCEGEFWYGSRYDTEKHTFHICEKCYDEKIKPLLKIEPEVENYI